MKRDVQYIEFPNTLSKVHSLTMQFGNKLTTYINRLYNGGKEMERKIYSGRTGELTDYKQ